MLPPRLAVLAVHVGSTVDPSSLRAKFAVWKQGEGSDLTGTGINEDQLLVQFCALLAWQGIHERCSEGADVAPLIESGLLEEIASTLHELASTRVPLNHIQVRDMVMRCSLIHLWSSHPRFLMTDPELGSRIRLFDHALPTS